MTTENANDLEKMWYTKCPECRCHYKWEHQCDWMMKILVDFFKYNNKEVDFIDVTNPNAKQN